MSSPTNKNHSRRGRYVAVILLLVIAGAAWTNRYNIIDWWKLRQYHAPSSISALAAQDTMTAYGRKIFYVNHPMVDDKPVFAKACPNNGGEQTIVLGCYHPGQSGIFLLDVNDPRLGGVQQVTAAHEMLHGAYERLSSSDRKRVDAMLLDYYNHDLHDQRIIKTIAAYKKSEPHDVVNEMHSVFGTEVAQLPVNLEQYYSRYFTNRAQVAAYAAQYQAQFTDREDMVARYDAQLAYLKAQITNAESDLQSRQNAINDLQNQLLTQKNSGDVNTYNAGVPNYNSMVDTYNAEVDNVQGLVRQYNQLVTARNAVALEEDQLVKALSTNVTPIQR